MLSGAPDCGIMAWKYFVEAQAVYLDLSCPLELLGYELSRDDQGKVRAYLHLNNLTERRVERIAGDIRWIHSGSGRQIAAPFIADQLTTPARDTFKLQLSTDCLPGADQLELVFSEISFQDGGPDWTQNADRLKRIEEPLPPVGAELNRLVAAAGVDAQNFPLVTGDYWICVCGRPNPAELNHCARCQRHQEDVLERLNRKAVLSGETPALTGGAVPEPEIPSFLGFDAPEPPPEVERRQRLTQELDMLHRQFKSQRNLLIRRSVFLLAVVVIVLLLMYTFEWLGDMQQQARDIIPPVRVEQAQEFEPWMVEP